MHKTRTTAAAAHHQEISKKVATIGLLLLTNWLKQQWVTLLQCSGRSAFPGKSCRWCSYRVCFEKVRQAHCTSVVYTIWLSWCLHTGGRHNSWKVKIYQWVQITVAVIWMNCSIITNHPRGIFLITLQYLFGGKIQIALCSKIEK